MLSSEQLPEKITEAFCSVQRVFAIDRTRDSLDKRYIIQKTDKDGRQNYVKNESSRKVTREITYHVTNKKMTARTALQEAENIGRLRISCIGAWTLSLERTIVSLGKKWRQEISLYSEK